jgi:hypothetical protein
MEYRCEITGTIYVEAETEEEAIQKAGESNQDKWNWDEVTADEWD